MATCGLSAPPPNATSCGGVGARRWWTKRWASRSPECWSAIATPPTTITMAPSSAAGPTCCQTSTSHPLPQRRRTGPMGRGSPPALCRSQSLQPSRAMAKACCPTGLGAEAARPSAALSCLTRRLSRASCAGASRLHQGIFVFVAEPDVPSDNNPAERQQTAPSGYQPQGQRRHPLGAGHREQDDAGMAGVAQGLNPLAACRQLLVSPRLELLPQTPEESVDGLQYSSTDLRRLECAAAGFPGD